MRATAQPIASSHTACTILPFLTLNRNTPSFSSPKLMAKSTSSFTSISTSTSTSTSPYPSTPTSPFPPPAPPTLHTLPTELLLPILSLTLTPLPTCLPTAHALILTHPRLLHHTLHVLRNTLQSYRAVRTNGLLPHPWSKKDEQGNVVYANFQEKKDAVERIVEWKWCLKVLGRVVGALEGSARFCEGTEMAGTGVWQEQMGVGQSERDGEVGLVIREEEKLEEPGNGDGEGEAEKEDWGEDRREEHREWKMANMWIRNAYLYKGGRDL